jgi:hypothetical protein
MALLHRPMHAPHSSVRGGGGKVGPRAHGQPRGRGSPWEPRGEDRP